MKLSLVAAGIIGFGSFGSVAFAGDLTADEMLTRLVADYRKDPSLVDATFGVKVGDDWWTVKAIRTEEGGTHEVTLAQGQPTDPTWYFKLESDDTLAKVYTGKLNALTSAAKAFSTDYAPLDMALMPGFQPQSDLTPVILATIFHFWTQSVPEKIPYGPDLTRETHGANASVFYYQPGFRSAFVNLRPGQHANEDPRSQGANDTWATLLIITEGKGKARIGGVETDVEPGNAYYIPPRTRHEFWNPYDKPMNGFILMFGEGA